MAGLAMAITGFILQALVLNFPYTTMALVASWYKIANQVNGRAAHPGGDKYGAR